MHVNPIMSLDCIWATGIWFGDAVEEDSGAESTEELVYGLGEDSGGLAADDPEDVDK